DGIRSVAVGDLYGDDGRTWLRIRPGELIVAIRLPGPSADVVHRKTRARAAIDYGAVLVAVRREEAGVRAVRVAAAPPPPGGGGSRSRDRRPRRSWPPRKPPSTRSAPTSRPRHGASGWSPSRSTGRRGRSEAPGRRPRHAAVDHRAQARL